MSVDNLLTFEQFSAKSRDGTPAYGEFWRYWAEGQKGADYINRPEAIGLRRQNIDLDVTLSRSIKRLTWRTPETLAPYAPFMYDAYKVMRGLGASNKRLFS